MKITILCGPAGSGKSTYRNELIKKDQETSFNTVYISGDEQGKAHFDLFKKSVENKVNHIIIDRMSFNKEQRNRFLLPAKTIGYTSEIVVFHVPRQICFDRIMARQNHPTINGKMLIDGGNEINSPGEKARQANSALDTFFTKYERVEDFEADKVTRLGWVEDTGKTKPAVIIDLDGTLCNIDHRLPHVKHENKKHNRWDLFNKEIPNDSLNQWCKQLYLYMGVHHPIILCSGRVDSSRQNTENWLKKHEIKSYRHLFMRHRSDFRQDYIIKEIILDFEILPRYNVLFAVDDRKQVVDMWRRRGIVTLACADGEF